MTSYFVNRSDVPPDVLTFTINLNNKGKRSKDTEVAELTIDLNTLTNGDEVSDILARENDLRSVFQHLCRI